MKAVLFLCLLALITCEKDLIDIGKCIYNAPKVQELISDVIVAIATKDYSKLLPKLKEALPELIQVVLGCITDNKSIEDPLKLEETAASCQKKKCNTSVGILAIQNCVMRCMLGK